MKSLRRSAGMAIAIGMLAACAGPRDLRAESAAPAAPVVVKLSPYAGTGLRTAEVSVGSAAPTKFIVDTGAGKTVLTPEDLPSARCVPFGRATGFRADGSPIAMSRCGPVALGVDGFHVQRELAVFDLMALLKGAPPVGGLLGLDAFDGAAVTLDWARDQLIVETPESLAERVKGMTRIPARITCEPSGAVEVFLQVKATVGTLWMELDTGNDGPVFLAPHALAQLGLQIPQGAQRDVALEVPGLGAIPVKVKQREMIYDGQLNPAFARQLVLTIDLAHREVWARPSAAR